MNGSTRMLLAAPLALAALGGILFCPSAAPGGPRSETYWRVDDVRPGMKGHGRTVMKGSKIESFEAEVLGVLKNTSPGRDLILCRLAGLGLERSGVIAGMSGSPVYLDGKLLGAVAYAWPFGKDPIAGVTPFAQMHGAVEAFERRDLAEQGRPTRVGLAVPVDVGGRAFDNVTISQGYDDPVPVAEDGLWLVPLRTPVAASGFGVRSLGLLRDRLRGSGLVPMQGGAAPARVVDEEKNSGIVPGSPLSVAMVTGDFDLSGIGTTTHVEGERVYGWGHPFMSSGGCDFPLQTGYIHTIYPRQNVSFKMGSPLRTVGVINADVSTCVAGWLGKKPDLLPVRMTVARESGGAARTYNVEVVRQRALTPTLVFTALANGIDMEGDLPDEMTTELGLRIEVEGHAPIVLKDVLSGPGYMGGRAPQGIYNPVANLLHLLTNNFIRPVRVTRVECDTVVTLGRRTAEIEAVELNSDTYAPGDAVRATIHLRPYRGAIQRVPLTLDLPADLPEGGYTLQVLDDFSSVRLDLRDHPELSDPRSAEQLLAALRAQTTARRSNLVLRLSLPTTGVAVGGKALPSLPPSMVQILGGGKRTGTQTVGAALTAKRSTDWVIQGSDSVRITVTKNKRPGF